MAFMDLFEPPVRDFVEMIVRERGDGRRIPVPTWDELTSGLGASTEGVSEAVRRRFERLATPQPLGTWRQPLLRRNPAAAAQIPSTLVACSFPLPVIQQLIAAGHPMFAELAGPNWSFQELPTGHWPLLSRPEDLADVLATVAGGT
jgi:hypothetical protein